MNPGDKLTCPDCGSDRLRMLHYADDAYWVACDKCGRTGDPAEDRRGAMVNWVKGGSE